MTSVPQDMSPAEKMLRDAGFDPGDLVGSKDLADFNTQLAKEYESEGFVNLSAQRDEEKKLKAERDRQRRFKQVQAEENGTKDEANGRKLTFIQASTIELGGTDFLWDFGLPQSRLCLLAGYPKTGKSTIASWIAAHVTRGTLEGGVYGTPKDVVIMCTEEFWDEDICPRLTVMGADMKRVYMVEVTKDDEDIGPVNFSFDVDAFKEGCKSLDVGLVIADPVIDHLGVINYSKIEEMRPRLRLLTKLAEDIEATVLAIVHFRKERDSNVLNMIGGSSALGQVARSSLLAAKDPDTGKGVLEVIAGNKSDGQEGCKQYEFHSIDYPAANGKTYKAGIIQFTGMSTVKASEIVSRNNTQTSKTSDDDSTDPKAFIEMMFEDEEYHWTAEFNAEAYHNNGIKTATLAKCLSRHFPEIISVKIGGGEGAKTARVKKLSGESDAQCRMRIKPILTEALKSKQKVEF